MEAFYSLDAEQSLIGSVLKNNSIIDEIKTKDREFYSRAHQVIFSTIQSLVSIGQPADLITVTQKLETEGRLDDVGGFVYVAEIIKFTTTQSNFAAYEKIIKDRYIKRTLLGALNEVQEQLTELSAKDACSIAEQSIGSVSEAFTENTLSMDMSSIAAAYVDELEKRALSGKSIEGISTGLPDLDEKTSGLCKSDLIILAARPSMGKTTLAMNMVETEALNGGYPLVFSLEMPCNQLMMRLVSGVGGIDLGALKKADLNEEQWARVSSATMSLVNTHMEINDNSGLTVQDIRLACREYKKRKGDLTLVMIDYLQLVKGEKAESRTQEISGISMGLKAIAKEFNCPVLALSQLNRSLENRADKRPINSDLRESGQLEQDADVIMFIYRDEVYNPQTVDAGLAEILIRKARNGEIGMVGSVFDGAKSKFRSLAGKTIAGEVAEEKKFF